MNDPLPQATTLVRRGSVLRPNPRVAHRDLAEEGGAVLLHLDTGAYHGINQVGTLIWKLLGEGTTFETLLTELRATFEDSPANLEEDIGLFLTRLADRDLIYVSPATP